MNARLVAKEMVSMVMTQVWKEILEVYLRVELAESLSKPMTSLRRLRTSDALVLLLLRIYVLWWTGSLVDQFFTLMELVRTNPSQKRWAFAGLPWIIPLGSLLGASAFGENYA